MQNKFYEDLNTLKNLSDELKNVKSLISKRKKEYEEQLRKDKELESSIDYKISELSSSVINVRLGDLLDNIALLTAVNKKDIIVSLKANMQTYGRLSLDKLIDYFKLDNCSGRRKKTMFLIITDSNDEEHKTFYIKVRCNRNLNAIQADGKPLYEHCSSSSHYEDYQFSFVSDLIIDKDLEDVVISFDLGFLDPNSQICFPNTLLNNALGLTKEYSDDTLALKK